MTKVSATETGTAFRADLLRAALLALLVGLIWCALYDRWSVESWQTPLTYLSDPVKADVLSLLATVKAARDGHFSPFQFTNIPELGAPGVANWDDYPTTEKPLLCAMGLLAGTIGLFPAVNFAVMFGQVLAALSFYAAGRLLAASWIWAFAGAIVFAFSRYAFAHGLRHITVLYYWHVPLDLVVCEWMFLGGGIKFGERRMTFALVVACVTGLQHIYYTNLFAQLVLIAGLLQAWRHGWRAILPAAAIIGITAAAFLLMNLNTIFYQLAYGANSEAVVRNYKWLEIYGLKLVDLVVPPPDHPFPPFAAWGAHHLQEILLAPGERPPSAYLGLLGLAALVWLTLVSLQRLATRKRLPLETWLVLWIVLYAGVGGLNGVLGTLGFQVFRATTRYSIVILCLVLLAAVRRLSLVEFRPKAKAYGLAGLLAVIAIWDQAPPIVSGTDLSETAQAVASDRNFTEKMEQGLPPQAMVFQIPVMDFPETPAPGVGPYDHFRPYLYSRQLRFSFGSDKGRPAQKWQHDLAGLRIEEVVARLESYGFAAIYLNRNGFTDQGAQVLDALTQMGRNRKIESDRGDLVCVFLKPSPQPILPDGF